MFAALSFFDSLARDKSLCLQYGDMDILIRTLDRHNININVRDDENGDTALILAAKGNNSKVIIPLEI